jgi:hypothetical protein
MRRNLTHQEITLVAQARECHREMSEDAEIDSAIRDYAKKHHIRSGGLFGDLVRVIDTRGSQHSDARLVAYANRTSEAHDPAYWN